MLRATHRVAAVATLVLLASPAAGCSAPAPIDPARVAPTSLPTVPTVDDPHGAITSLRLGQCLTTAGKQSVSGSFISPAASTADFLLTIAWTTPQGDVRGRAVKVFTGVEPGASREFTVKATVADGASVCVPGLSYGSIG